jgi:hypothetical protein
MVGKFFEVTDSVTRATMHTVRAVGMSLFLFTISTAAYAGNDVATQVGSVDCYNLSCPKVTFPNQFGGVPTVVVSVAGLHYNFVGTAQRIDLHTGANAVTASGFTPVITSEVGNWLDLVRISWVAVGPAVLPGTAVPKYLVLSVIYAPPGTNGGHSTSKVSYQAGSTTGTTTAASQSFKAANSISFEASGGILGNGGGGGISFEWSRTRTDSQSLEIKKSTNSTIDRSGPSQDGINHDEDDILLLLNPTVDLGLTSSSAQWIFANSQSIIQEVCSGPGSLNRFSASLSGVSAGVRLPCGWAAG